MAGGRAPGTTRTAAADVVAAAPAAAITRVPPAIFSERGRLYWDVTAL